MELNAKTLKLMRIAAIVCYVVAVLDFGLFIYYKVPVFSPAGILFLFGFISTFLFGLIFSTFKPNTK